MSDTWSGQITFSGLGSGTDWGSIISATIEVESYRKNQMESWKADWEEKSEALQELNQAMLELRTWLKEYDTPREFLVKTAESTNTDAVTATASSDADEGVHTVVVNQLAQNDIWMATDTPISDTTASLTASNASMTIGYAGKSTTLDVPAGTTAQGLVNLINNNPDLSGGVRAKLLYDGSGYYLQIRGMDLGAGKSVSISSSTVPGLTSSDFTRTQQAQNAQIKVDGFPSAADKWIEIASNTAEDVIDGVTLNLKDVTGASGLKITVDTDTDAVKENIQGFVDKVNEVRSLILDMQKVDSSGNGSVLTGNYGLQMVGQSLKDLTGRQATGFEYYNSTTGLGDLYSSLSHIGILTEASESSVNAGLLVIDEEALDEALANDPTAVALLFSADSIGESASPEVSFQSLVKGLTQPGRYDVEYTVSGGKIVSATINGHEALVSGWEITGQYGHPEAGLAVRVENQADGTYKADVGVRQGKIPELVSYLDAVTNEQTGTLAIIEDNYQDIITNLEKKIEWEEARLERKKQVLTERYARLEAALATYDSLQTQLENQIAALDS